jgi:hypothetical protein
MSKRDLNAIATYRETHPCCAVAGWWQQVIQRWAASEYLAKCNENRDRVSGGWLECPETHHIIGGGFRYDVPCNLITICGYAHAWIHEADPIAGKIVCWRVKLSLGEFDPEAIHDLWNRNVAGWLEFDDVVKRCKASERLDQWRRELIEHCERATA